MTVVKIDDPLHRELKMQAASEGLPLNQLASEILRGGLAERRAKIAADKAKRRGRGVA